MVTLEARSTNACYKPWVKVEGEIGYFHNSKVSPLLHLLMTMQKVVNLQQGNLPDINLTVWTDSIPPNSYSEALTPSAMVFTVSS